MLIFVLLRREWDRFAKGEYERLAMEEEGGDDSEMIDAMDGWDSEDDTTAAQGDSTSSTTGAATEETKADWAGIEQANTLEHRGDNTESSSY